jgi:hypothetical protein
VDKHELYLWGISLTAQGDDSDRGGLLDRGAAGRLALEEIAFP